MATVRLIATDKMYMVSPYYIAPKHDPATKTYKTGQEDYTEEQKKKAPLIITEEDSFPFKHLQVFNTELEIDRLMLELAKNDNGVAKSKMDVKPGQHRFYIENKEDEAKDVVSKADRQFEAMTFVRNLEFSSMVDLARLLGVYVKDYTQNQVESALKGLCQTDPEKIIEASTDKDRKYKVFIHKLIQAGVLNITNGKYQAGKEVIGVNEDYAIAYMKDSVNSRIVNQWNNMVNPEVELPIVHAREVVEPKSQIVEDNTSAEPVVKIAETVPTGPKKAEKSAPKAPTAKV